MTTVVYLIKPKEISLHVAWVLNVIAVLYSLQQAFFSTPPNMRVAKQQHKKNSHFDRL